MSSRDSASPDRSERDRSPIRPDNPRDLPWHSFIIHNYGIDNIPGFENGRHPTFFAFQHNREETSHTHLVWQGSQSVRARSMATIMAALGIANTPQGTAARTTIITIFDITKFLAYLFRANGRNKSYGSNPTISTFLRDVAPNIITDDDGCTLQEYNRHSRRTRETRANEGEGKSDKLGRLDELREITTRYEASSGLPATYNDFVQNLDDADYRTLFNLFGNYWDQYAKKELAHQLAVYCKKLASGSFIEWLEKHESENNEIVTAWLNLWFEKQQIRPEQFIARTLVVLDRETKKKNCICIIGRS